MENEVVECRWQGPQAVKFLASLDKNVLRDAQATQAAVRPPHALDRRLAALRHDNEQVQVAAFIRRAPRV